MYIMCMSGTCPWKSEEGMRFLGTGVTDGNELLYEFWEHCRYK